MKHGKILFAAAILTFVFMLVMSAASRAQMSQPASPEMQAVQQSLMQEINTNLQLRAAVITLQQQLEKTQAEVKKLTDKYEPKKDEPKK